MRPFWWIFLGVMLLGTTALQVWGPPNPHPHAWDSIPGFFAIFGLTGCLMLILVAKGLAKLFLQRKEDYYDHDEP
jgi:hypothetical protein